VAYKQYACGLVLVTTVHWQLGHPTRDVVVVWQVVIRFNRQFHKRIIIMRANVLITQNEPTVDTRNLYECLQMSYNYSFVVPHTLVFCSVSSSGAKCLPLTLWIGGAIYQRVIIPFPLWSILAFSYCQLNAFIKKKPVQRLPLVGTHIDKYSCTLGCKLNHLRVSPTVKCPINWWPWKLPHYFSYKELIAW